ncbi:hypothetical protein [Halosolutus gelatinilyticus]|uniref:hypothetical protein n=1 Tax=Halosolutus gelatinilyticus TaxID=2931975 RepID=UPI001FF2E083|nr:hypothetical protein [Halosolutus gelatinilyticus]
MVRPNESETEPIRPIDRRDVLRGTAGAVAAGLGVAAFSGGAAAHFPSELDVDVVGAINPDTPARVPVRIRRTEIDGEEFDPTERDLRYRFGSPDGVADGGGATPVDHVEQPNAVWLFFRADETGFDGDDSTGELRWDKDETREHGYSGTDSVHIVGRRSR